MAKIVMMMKMPAGWGGEYLEFQLLGRLMQESSKFKTSQDNLVNFSVPK